uniref:Uncharacterized protein n=1 Tax=Arundo donax TaxID=35708 RepID=A0A0A9DS03_ARUDO
MILAGKNLLCVPPCAIMPAKKSMCSKYLVMTFECNHLNKPKKLTQICSSAK